MLAFAPAGSWRKRSPRVTNAGLMLNWRIGQLAGRSIETTLKPRIVRIAGLRNISARPGDVSYETALKAARAAQAAKNFPRHFAETKVPRFERGDRIPPTVPVRVVFGREDRVAPPGKSRYADELPDHATVEIWEHCGHMVMWDRPQDTVRAILETSAAPAVSLADCQR